jgi:short-subunit dehydrogenase
MAKITGKRVIVTGASSGIGKAIAFELARKGARLVLTSRRFDILEKVAQEIENTFPQVTSPLVIACDVVNREQVNRVIHFCVEYFGGIDILVNNAGIGVYGSSEKTSSEDFRSQMEVNFLGSVHFILEALPLMKQARKGLIVNVSSLAAKHGVPYLGAYGASKAALAVLSQSLRAELARSGISVLTVYPGYTETDLFKKEKKVGGARRPTGPYTSPQKVAEAVIKSIEKEKYELIPSVKGKALILCQSLMPWLVRKAMERIAYDLRDEEEASDGKT